MEGSIGETIGGRYQLIDQVGSGGAGVVWRAKDQELAREVAIKLLPCESDEQKARIWREARLAALLSDSGAVSVFDFGDDGDHCFLVMELIHSQTLRALLDKQYPTPLIEQDTLEIGHSLSVILSKAHHMSLIHRDIKPSNIFIFGELGGHISSTKLVDFGLAFLESSHRGGLGRLSLTGLISGTPAYLSPEQARDDDIGKPTDVYSLGCVLYELSCGEPPFYGAVPEVLSKHIYVPAISLTERIESVSGPLSKLVDQMLAKSPAERPTMELVQSTLVQFQQQKLPNAGSRRRRSSKGLVRAERMIEVTQTPDSDDSGVTQPRRIGDEQEGLTTLLRSEGVFWEQQEQKANVIITTRPLTKGEMDKLSLPIVIWVADNSLDIASLIRHGYSDVISPNTSGAGLTRRLNRARKRHAKTI